MLLRSCAIAIAAVTLAGCASGGYGSYGAYPAYYDAPYYYDGPYYGGGFGYHHSYFDGHDHDDDRYFRPGGSVTCDRARDICYDQHGLSYGATRRYLGEREANRAYKKYGKDVFVFSPRDGVTCDRRTETCSSGRWTDRIYGDAPSRPRKAEVRRDRSKLQDDDRAAANRHRLSPDLRGRPNRLADDDDANPVRRPSARAQSRNEDRPAMPPRFGGACPLKGCPDK